ncbi:MaoC/PaaZ C-terminal domain-containing protein [Georgenia halophila]|uniref:MaoC/PaaZ C-terminal domain-containing protein n=1 Tax=Georgenia halophila TaxID=620889 RepID=UPI0031E76943
MTASRVRAYHDACGLDSTDDCVSPFFLAAALLPLAMKLARSAVPRSRHATGLHAGHRVTVDRPLFADVELESTMSTTRRSTSAGELVTVDVTSTTDDGDVAVRQGAAFLFGGPRGPSRSRSPDGEPPRWAAVRTRFPPGSACAYAEASGDRQPLHLDEGAAVAAGFPRCIAHGLCTLAFVVADVARLAGADPRTVTATGARFAGPAYWDDTLLTAVEEPGATGTGQGFSTWSADGPLVLTHGYMDLAQWAHANGPQGKQEDA